MPRACTRSSDHTGYSTLSRACRPRPAKWLSPRETIRSSGKNLRLAASDERRMSVRSSAAYGTRKDTERQRYVWDGNHYGVSRQLVCVSERSSRCVWSQWVQAGGGSGSERAPTPWLVRRGACFQSVKNGESTALPRQARFFRLKRRDCKSRTLEYHTRAVQQARVCSTGSGSGFGLFRGQMDDLDRLDGMPAAGEAGHQFRPQPAAHPAHA